MDEKQRKLKRDVAASVIGSSIRGFIARKRYAAMKKRKAELKLKQDVMEQEAAEFRAAGGLNRLEEKASSASTPTATQDKKQL